MPIPFCPGIGFKEVTTVYRHCSHSRLHTFESVGVSFREPDRYQVRHFNNKYQYLELKKNSLSKKIYTGNILSLIRRLYNIFF